MLELPYSLGLTNPLPIDGKYNNSGIAYASAAAACLAVPRGLRYSGLTVLVGASGAEVEMWWLSGDFSDAGLAPKAAGLALGSGVQRLNYPAVADLLNFGRVASGSLYIIKNYPAISSQYPQGQQGFTCYVFGLEPRLFAPTGWLFMDEGPCYEAILNVQAGTSQNTTPLTDYYQLSSLPTGTSLALTNTTDFATAAYAGKTFYVSQAFDLGGRNVVLAKNLTLVFAPGGSMTNGTLTGANTTLVAGNNNIFGLASVSLLGSWLNLDFRPEWWGDNTNGTATYNWQPALQQALNAAGLRASAVQLGNYYYRYYGTVEVPAGVTLKGVGSGSTALGSGAGNGTVLHHQGFWTATAADRVSAANTAGLVALRIMGNMVWGGNFFIRGSAATTDQTTGIQFYGVGRVVENCRFNDVVIHNFLGGIGWHEVAGNAGSVTYCNHRNLRFRNCKWPFKREVLGMYSMVNFDAQGNALKNRDKDGNEYTTDDAFLNTNMINGLFIGGGGIDRALWIRSEKGSKQTNSQDVYWPNNNHQFDDVVIEPYFTPNGHVWIEGGGSQIIMRKARIEAAQQDQRYAATPVIYLGPGTNGNVLDLDLTNVVIQDLGFGNYIQQRSVKSSIPTPNSTNIWKNAALVGLSVGVGVDGAAIYQVPEWQIEEQCVDPNGTYAWRPLQVNSAITIAYDPAVMMAEYKALAFSVPPFYQLRIVQGVNRTDYNLTQANVSCYVKTSTFKGVCFTYQDQVTPIVSLGAALGTGNWEAIGGGRPVSSIALSPSYYRIPVFVQNAGTNTTNINFSVTRPSFVLGDTTTQDTARFIKDTGGTVYGVLAGNVVRNIAPVTNPAHRGLDSSDVMLPQEGNTFEVTDSGFVITRINSSANRFPRGSTIMLVFTAGNVSISSNVLLTLTKDFIAEPGATITLQSRDGNGIWREVGRSSKRVAGLTTVDLSTVQDAAGGTTFTLPVDGSNIYSVTNNAASPYSIARLNNITRMPSGTQIWLNFVAPGGNVQLLNSGYIVLAKAGPYVPADGDWLLLMTNGNGTWVELQRKQLTVPMQSKGNAVLDIATGASVFTNPSLLLPLTGENYFTLNNTSASTVGVQRISDGAAVRHAAGTEVLITFGTLTSLINFVPSAYLILNAAGNYVPSPGDWIKLGTDGTGVWKEITRKGIALPMQSKGTQNLTLTSTNLAAGVLALSVLGENFFRLDATSFGGNITRINFVQRMSAGTIIILKFVNVTSPVKLLNSGYINLAGGTDWTPALNNTILLFTPGDGTWEEISRRTT